MPRRNVQVVVVSAGLAAGLVASLVGGVALGGDDKGGKPAAGQASRDAAAAEFLRGLRATRDGQTDEQAVATIGRLVGFWKDANVSAQTKQTIPGVLAWYSKRDSDAVVLAAINAFASIGRGPGTQRLVTILEGLALQKEPPADQVAAAFRGLQGAADPEPAITGAVLRFIAHKDKKFALQAISTLGAYSAAPVALRRRLFEEALSAYESMSGAAARAKANAPAAPAAGAPGEKPADNPPPSPPAGAGGGATDKPADPAALKSADALAIDKWAAVAMPAVQSLGILAHQSFADLPAARTWLAHAGRDGDSWK